MIVGGESSASRAQRSHRSVTQGDHRAPGPTMGATAGATQIGAPVDAWAQGRCQARTGTSARPRFPCGPFKTVDPYRPQSTRPTTRVPSCRLTVSRTPVCVTGVVGSANLRVRRARSDRRARDLQVQVRINTGWMLPVRIEPSESARRPCGKKAHLPRLSGYARTPLLGRGRHPHEAAGHPGNGRQRSASRHPRSP